MTLGTWLRARRPSPPERLLARIEEILGDRCQRDATDATELCLDAAERLLRDLTSRSSMRRDAALDLLTVDALTTYAFEAAAEDSDAIGARASAAMARLGACVPR